jgi:phosphatidylserine/phosphatidylglycerophosphate/cardiolipin synthase-like enzyme
MPTTRSSLPLPIVLLALALLLGAYATAEFLHTLPAAPQRTGSSLLDRGAVRAYFTTPSLIYPDDERRRPGVPLLNDVVADLHAARRSIDLAVFDLDLPELGDALLRAEGRGVRVRLVLDSHNLEAPEMAALAGRLQNAGVGVRFDRREPFMHDKFIVVDERVVWAGSWNMTANDTFRNNNNMLRIASTALAGAYDAEFEQLYAGRFGGAKRAVSAELGSRLAVFFSPEGGAEREIVRRIAAARHSVRFLAFSFTSAPIAEAMVRQARAGVAVRGVMERQNAAGTGSVFGLLHDGGVAVAEDGSCYLLHHKAIVIDDRVVITGSYNFTGSAEHSNDETLLVLEDAGVAQLYLAEFERLAALAESPQRCQ